MKVIKYKTFKSSEQFELWQIEYFDKYDDSPKIHSIFPINFSADANSEERNIGCNEKEGSIELEIKGGIMITYFGTRNEEN